MTCTKYLIDEDTDVNSEEYCDHLVAAAIRRYMMSHNAIINEIFAMPDKMSKNITIDKV